MIPGHDKYGGEVEQAQYNEFTPSEKRGFWEYQFRKDLQKAGLDLESLSQEEVYRLAGKLTLSDIGNKRRIDGFDWDKFPDEMKTLERTATEEIGRASCRERV